MNDAESRLKLNITQSIVMLVTIMAIIATVFCASAFGESSQAAEAAQPVVHERQQTPARRGREIPGVVVVPGQQVRGVGLVELLRSTGISPPKREEELLRPPMIRQPLESLVPGGPYPMAEESLNRLST